MTSMNDSVELCEKIEKIKEECSLEFGGCKVHKFIWLMVMMIILNVNVNFDMLQRMAGDHFDKDGSALVRIQSDGPPKTASPHILAVRIGQ